MAPYQYRQLDEAKEELRLIKLQPAPWEDRIELHIQHIPLCESRQFSTIPSTLTEVRTTLPPEWVVYETLEGRCLFENTSEEYSSWEHPDVHIPKSTYTSYETGINQEYAFEALSYTWGNDIETTPVYITDTDAGIAGILLVRPNLATALQYLRHPDKERTLWVDAICIDQSNLQDSRDRIYAVLGLLDPRFSSFVDPDYGITPMMTYQRACQSWMNAYDRLSFLEFCDMPRGVSKGSSWVPDWSKGLPREPMTFGRFASGQSGTGGARIIDDKILEVVGVTSGVISWVEELGQRNGHGTWEYWRSMSMELLRYDEKLDSNDAQLDAFVAALCGNRVREMYPSHIYWPTVSQCRESLKSINERGLRRSETGFDAFQSSVQDFTCGRRLFRSSEYMGFGSQSIAKGEETSEEQAE